MSIPLTTTELVPEFTRRTRARGTALLALLVVTIPALAWAGLIRPNVVAGTAIRDEWNQDTGVGSGEILVENRGLIPVTVIGVTSQITDLELEEPVRIAGRSEGWVGVSYVITCDGGSPAVSDDDDSGSLEVRGPWPTRLDYDLDLDGVLTAGMCGAES